MSITGKTDFLMMQLLTHLKMVVIIKVKISKRCEHRLRMIAKGFQKDSARET